MIWRFETQDRDGREMIVGCQLVSEHDRDLAPGETKSPLNEDLIDERGKLRWKLTEEGPVLAPEEQTVEELSVEAFTRDYGVVQVQDLLERTIDALVAREAVPREYLEYRRRKTELSVVRE